MSSEYLKGSKAIGLFYTQEEWDMLEIMATKRGYPNFRAYLNAALHTAAKKISVREKDNDEDCYVCKKKSNKFFIPKDITPHISQFADGHCLPITTAIRIFFVDPLIKEHETIIP